MGDRIPVSSATADRPSFAYSEGFFGAQIEIAVHRALHQAVPRMIEAGELEPWGGTFNGMGFVLYRPEDTDWRKPWISLCYNGQMQLFDPCRPDTSLGFSPEAVVCNINARKKSPFTMRTGLPSIAAATTHRHLRLPGDEFPFGGAVLKLGLLGSTSAFSQEQDEVISELALDAAIKGMQDVIDGMNMSWDAKGDDGPLYFGSDLTAADYLRMARRGELNELLDFA